MCMYVHACVYMYIHVCVVSLEDRKVSSSLPASLIIPVEMFIQLEKASST